MIAQIVAFALLGSTGMGANPGPVEISLNVKDGDTISGEFRFRVKVTTDALVNQVEFYVGDDLRDTKSSTPYEFKFDTLDPNQPEGDVKLTFAAYTTSGDSAKKTFKLKIDNALGKGADYYVQHGLDLVTVGKYDEAITAARIALKVKPNDGSAKLVMARAYLGKNVLDSAQKYAEDVSAADPNDFGARDLLSAIELKRAFSTLNREGNSADVLANIGTAMKQAVENRRKNLESRLDKFGAVTPENLLKYADLCLTAGRYGAAIQALEPALKHDERNAAIANRLVYAQMRAGRFNESALTLSAYVKRGQLDAYGNALLSVQRAVEGDNDASDEAMKEAILDDPQNLGVRTAQAYIALRRSKTAVLTTIAQDLEKDAGERPEVNYYLAAVFDALGRLEEGRERFLRALLADPLCYDIYVQSANDALLLAARGHLEKKDVDFQYDVAKLFYETALAARPESAEALTGLCLVYGYQKKVDDSVKYGHAAVAAGPGYPAGYYSLACALSGREETLHNQAIKAEKDGRHDEANKLYADSTKVADEAFNAKEKAGQLDTAYLGGIAAVPKLAEAYTYFVRHGKLPLLSPPD